MRAVLIEISSTLSEVLKKVESLNPARYAAGGVLVKGGPCWLAALVVHELGHPARWAAIWSPEEGSFRVVMRHHPEAPKEGALIKEDEVQVYERLVL